MVTTAHHMELGMEMNWLRGFSVSLNTDTVSCQLSAGLGWDWAPLCVVDCGAEDDHEHGEAVDPDDELLRRGPHRLHLRREY